MHNSFTITKRVEFSETDMAGIVHFSQYFRYMEMVEHAFFRSHGLSVFMELDGKKISWPRVACSFEYYRPIHFEEEVELHLQIEKIGRKSLEYTVSVCRGEEEMARGRSTIVCCCYEPGGEIQSMVIPQVFLEKLRHS